MLRQRKDGRADGDAVDRMDSSKPTWKVCVCLLKVGLA